MTIDEYNQLVDQCADNLYRFLYKSVQDQGIAKDLVQDAFMKLWLNIRNIQPAGAKKYLFTTGYNCMVDHFRKARKMQASSDKLVELTVPEQTNELQEILHLALNTLPETQKTLILLRDYEGYNYQEMGDITGLSESQVKVYLYRARTALKDILIKYNKINSPH